MITSVFGFIMAPVMGSKEPTPEPLTVPRCVLLEDFTNDGCPPCPARSDAIRQVLEMPGYGYDVVAPIFYHVWWPNPGDTFYVYNTAENTARVNFYGVGAVPWSFYDGQDLGQSSDPGVIQSHIDTRLGLPSDILITSSGTIDDVGLTGEVSARIQAVEDIPDTDLVVFFGLWEHNVTRFGGNDPIYEWAMWDMVPSASGTPIWSSGATSGQFVDLTYPFTIEADWNVSELGMSIWVQKPAPTREVFQAHVEQFNFVNTLPNVTVEDNNGQAEDGTWASIQTIRWNATDPDEPDADLDILVEVSPDNGFSWFIIENGVDNNDGECTWDTTLYPDSTDYIVRVTARDSEPMSTPVVDTSDAIFTVDNTPSIDLFLPDGGEMYAGGSAQNIQWNMDDFLTPHNQLVVDLYYSTDGGATYPNTIAMGLTGFGSDPCGYLWDPLPMIDNDQVRVRAVVTDTDALTNLDASAANFEIDSTAPAPASNVYCELEGTNVHIYWDPSPSVDVDHYKVWWRMNAFDSTGMSYTSFIDAGLNTDVLHIGVGVNNPQSYTYQVRTYDGVGHETITTIQGAKYGSTQSVFSREPDWFLLGNPLSQMDDSFANVIQGQGLPASYDCIRTYNGLTDTWHTSIAGWPVVDLTNIPTDSGFWMHITSSTRFCTAGFIEDKVINLYDGWNFVAYPFATRSMTAASIEAHLMANCPGYVSMLVEDVTMPYHLKTPAGTENVFHNQGFFVYVSGDTTWTVTNY
jgi:hypothetical protein